MNISAVRKMLKTRIKNDFASQADYSRSIGVTPNNLSLFLLGSGAYRKRVPKKVLQDLNLNAITVTTYHKRVII